ncbi:MAG: DNA-deoxyinosine glycosylase [Christensenellales bacterium]
MGEKLKCFTYIADENSRALILGSMPSVRSLQLQQYYAHPQNRFWRVMFALAGREFSSDYQEKKSVLAALRVALWDTIGECERVGSMDGNIKNAQPNDIAGLLEKYPDIVRIAANGGKSAETLKKFFPQISFVRLPSTSPANAAVSLNKLIEEYGRFIFG